MQDQGWRGGSAHCQRAFPSLGSSKDTALFPPKAERHWNPSSNDGSCSQPVPFACPWVRVLRWEFGASVLTSGEKILASSLKGSICSDIRIFPWVFNVYLKWKKNKTKHPGIYRERYVCFKQAWSCLETGLGIVRGKKMVKKPGLLSLLSELEGAQR